MINNNVPSTIDATLPAKYEAASKAIAECARIDECKDWADKAAALASYTRQSEDQTLHKAAVRINNRAYKRMGQLLEEVEKAPGKRTDRELRGGGSPRSRKESAADAGLSPDQAKKALRVNRASRFDEQNESEDPPTSAELERQGTKTKPKTAHFTITKQDHARMHIIGSMEDYVKQIQKHDINDIISGCPEVKRRKLFGLIHEIDTFHSKLGEVL